MSEMQMKAQIDAPADAVWGTVRDFGNPQKFIAAIEACTLEGSGVGAVRTLSLGSTTVVERLEALDDAARSLTYSIVSAPLPLEGYVATMRVRALGPDRCEVEWSCSFKPKGATEEEVKDIVRGVYAAGFAGLRKLHEG